MIHVHVNGETHQLPGSVSILELLSLVDVPPNYLAVEVNEEVIPRENHGLVRVSDGDHVEVVTLVGGG
ncbi:MAG: sulfur carrier protein ThiS [Planctomycetota bacterium]